MLIVVKIDKQYVIRQGYSIETLVIDGEKVCAKEICIDHEPKKIEIYRLVKEVSHYENEDRSASLGVEEFKSELGELAAKGNDDGVFANLDDEFAYKKHLRAWKPVYVEVDSFKPIEFRIEVYPLSEYADIKPFRYVGKENFDDGNFLCAFLPNAHKAAREIATELGFEEVSGSAFSNVTKGKKFSISDRDANDLEYLKINDSYVFGSRNKGKWFSLNAATYSECVGARNRMYDDIRAAFSKQKLLIDGEGRSISDVTRVYKSIEHIKDLVSSARFFNKDLSTKQTIVRSLNNILEDLSK